MVFVPIKVNVLLWRVVYNKLPTRQNLVDRNVDIPSFLCQSCSLEVEDCKHVFVDCEVASQVWIKVVKWLDLPFPLIINVTELLYWVDTVSLPDLKKKVLEVIVLTTIWMILQYRNNVFRSPAMKRSGIFESIRIHSFNWFINRCNKSSITWILWLQNSLIQDFV